jgi:DNA primase catalytic subunit
MPLVGRPTPASPSRELSPHQSRSLTDNSRRRHRKEEEDSHLHIDKNTIRANLKRLRSARLIRRDSKVMKLDMQMLQK